MNDIISEESFSELREMARQIDDDLRMLNLPPMGSTDIDPEI